jgi:hypothetical protein
MVGTASLDAPVLIVVGHPSGSPPLNLTTCDHQVRGTAPTP